MNRYFIALTLTGALALSACKKDPPADIPVPPRDTITTPTPTPGPSTNTGPVVGVGAFRCCDGRIRHDLFQHRRIQRR